MAVWGRGLGEALREAEAHLLLVVVREVVKEEEAQREGVVVTLGVVVRDWGKEVAMGVKEMVAEVPGVEEGQMVGERDWELDTVTETLAMEKVALPVVGRGVTVREGRRVVANPEEVPETHREKVPGGDVPMVVCVTVAQLVEDREAVAHRVGVGALVVPMGHTEGVRDPERVGTRVEAAGVGLPEVHTVREGARVEAMGVRLPEVHTVRDAALVVGTGLGVRVAGTLVAIGVRDMVRDTDGVRLVVVHVVRVAPWVVTAGERVAVGQTVRVTTLVVALGLGVTVMLGDALLRNCVHVPFSTTP